jgi:triacylglycerol lipase
MVLATSGDNGGRHARRAAIVTGALFLGAGSWVVGGECLAPTARADEPQYDVFYNPPDVLPGQPGDVIRDEPSRLVLEPSGQLGGFRATGTRIMYDSDLPRWL